MATMLDGHVTPVGMPLGITEQEKQMWIAVYSAARKRVALGECATAEEATKQITAEWGKSKGRDSRAFIFALRWSKSINVLLNMKQARHLCAHACVTPLCFTPVLHPCVTRLCYTPVLHSPPLPRAAQHQAGLPPTPIPTPTPNVKQDFRFCDGSYQEVGHS